MTHETGKPENKRRILATAARLEALGVNVLGFLEQAEDGEERARRLGPLFDARNLASVAEDLRADLENPGILFAPSFLWSVARLRRELWSGDEEKPRERDVRRALAQVADALADRRTGTHGRPKPEGARRRTAEDLALVDRLAEIASTAVRALVARRARREETVAYYLHELKRADFWDAVDLADPPTKRLNDIFRKTLAEPRRPSLGTVVAAAAAVRMGSDVDPAIFGGRAEADHRATARSLAIRALRKVRPENLEIPRK